MATHPSSNLTYTRGSLFTATLLMVSLLLTACGGSGAARNNTTASIKTTYLIGMSQANDAEPWRQAMNAQIAAAAEKYPAFQLVFLDAAQNNTKQVEDVRSLIEQKIDLLIISPNEATPLTNVVAEAFDKGIPVIVLDRKVNGDKYTMWIGADNKLIGKKAGEYVAQWCREQQRIPCNVIELRGLEGSTPATERGDGFREGIAANPDVRLIASQNADWLRERAVSMSSAMFNVNPAVDVLYGHNDPMAEGAIDAATQAKIATDKVLFVGIDALPTSDGGIRSVLDGRLGVTYVYPTGGEQAIEWAHNILIKQIPPPREIILDTEEVTKENAAAIYQKYGGQ